MLGLDTTAIIDIFRGDPGIKKFLENNKEPLATNMLNYLEIHFGIDAKDDYREIAYYEEFFNSTYFLELTREASREASSIHWTLKKKGKQMSKFDCVVAACFLEHGIKKIVTRNVKHFEHITEIEVITY